MAATAMDEGTVTGASARGLALTTTTAATTKDTHDNADSTSGVGNAANNNSGSSSNNTNARYLSNLSDCQNVSSSGGVGGSGRGGSSELGGATSVVTPTITHIKQSPTSPSPMSTGAAEATTVVLQQHQQQHHHRQSDELMYGGANASASAIVTHPHSTLSTLDLAHQQQVHTHAHAQQQHQLHQQQQQQQQSQHLQRLGSLSNINTSATSAAADAVSISRGSLGVGPSAITHPSLLTERPPPPPYHSSSSSNAAIMTSKVFHAGSCAATSMEAISGDEPPTARLSAYEQFLKLSAHEYGTTTSVDNAAVLNLSNIGKAADSDLMLRHVNVAAAMAAAAVESVGAVEGSSVVGTDGCKRN
ncbi:AT-rich binding protein-like [Rhagoletis pomonella]|uniref:AT-rich binding protein-like n=1 Tax=Rhagoletis pomonella TaxID=28610 RepID=UPI00177BB4AB|nr:AT-rich binding protein-like [Rhagoletis pomonella]XP_036344356.1 AT-rich binding protein-like [Rhagoletis pomonella]